MEAISHADDGNEGVEEGAPAHRKSEKKEEAGAGALLPRSKKAKEALRAKILSACQAFGRVFIVKITSETEGKD